MVLSLKEVPLFQACSEKELAEIQTVLREKSFAKGETLFFEGNPCERIFIIQSGRAKLYKTSFSGKEQILEILEAGDTCACNPGSCGWMCGSSAQAVTSCKVWYIPREHYERLIKTNNKLTQVLNRLFAEKIRKFTTLLEEVSLKDVKKRLVKFLLDMQSDSMNSEKSCILSIPFTREEIAQRIGTSRETVARYLSQLKQAALIELEPSKIVICDRTALEKLL